MFFPLTIYITRQPSVILIFHSSCAVDDYNQGFEFSRESRAQADLKFTYVVSCQIYGQQKQQKKPEATDIALLLQRYLFNFLFCPIVD